MNAMHRFPCDVGWAKTGRGGRMSGTGWDVWEVGDKKMIVKCYDSGFKLVISPTNASKALVSL